MHFAQALWGRRHARSAKGTFGRPDYLDFCRLVDNRDHEDAVYDVDVALLDVVEAFAEFTNHGHCVDIDDKDLLTFANAEDEAIEDVATRSIIIRVA